MKIINKISLCLLCTAMLLPAVSGAFANGSAAGVPGGPEPVVISCTEIPLYLGEDYLGSGFLVNSVTYVPLLTFTEHMLGDICDVDWDQETGTATIESEKLSLSLTVDQGYMTANGRYLFFEDGIYNVNGTLLVPIRELAKIFCLELEWDSTAWAIRLDDSNSEIFASGEEFYDADDVFWLARVIYSEAANQPLEGMIGVGNVVLNRKNDEEGQFGSTIVEVIFQPGQFDVVSSGMIYCVPSEEAETAAKLCLEGYNTVGDSKWFLNPRIGISTWMRLNRTLKCTIADHDFYA